MCRSFLGALEANMAGQLIPPPGTDADLPSDATPQQGIAVWLDLMRSGSKFLIAGIRREIGPDGDLKSALRAWYEDQMRQHDKVLERMMDRIHRPNDGEKMPSEAVVATVCHVCNLRQLL